MTTKRCDHCGVMFRAPAWVKFCFFCGGDDGADPLLLVAAGAVAMYLALTIAVNVLSVALG